MDSVSQSSLKKYRKLRTPDTDFDFDDPSSSSLSHSENSDAVIQKFKIGSLNPEKFIWILIGVSVIYFANLHKIILPFHWPQNTWKFALCIGYICLAIFACLFFYLNYYLKYFCGIKITVKHWKRDAPRAVPAATLSGSCGFLFLCIGFIPYYHLWSILIFPTLFMSFFALISLF